MSGPIRRISAGFLGALLWAGSGLAQSSPPTFPTFLHTDPQRIGIVSQLNDERRGALVGFLDAADTAGLFPADVEARGQGVEYGMVLYVLPSLGCGRTGAVPGPAALCQRAAQNG